MKCALTYGPYKELVHTSDELLLYGRWIEPDFDNTRFDEEGACLDSKDMVDCG